MAVVMDCGLNQIECSADTECDMLYSDRGYLDEWSDSVARESAEKGINIASVYTGHGTYSTLGLTHTDRDCRERMLTQWLFPHIDNAAKLKAIAGFYCHAFDDSALQDPRLYAEYKDILYNQMGRIAVYCAERGVMPSLEQMYSPQQYPWRISDAKDLIKGISRRYAPMYITIDTGHQYGQQLFLKPTREEILDAVSEGGKLYVGPEKCARIFEDAKSGEISADQAADEILEINEAYPHMFAERSDSDTWKWLRELGRYSPLVHLQQTDNKASAHKGFSPADNAKGCVTGDKVLRSLYEGYCLPEEEGMPEPLDKIYLTLELFYSIVTSGNDIIKDLKASVEYWRQFVPEDGIPLDELVKKPGVR